MLWKSRAERTARDRRRCVGPGRLPFGWTQVAERARAEIAGQRMAAPHGIDLECVSVFRGLVLGGRLGEGEADRAVELLSRMPLRRYSHLPLLGRVWELRLNAWPFDAAYVALAELLDVTLFTVDEKLASIPGVRCPIRNLRAGD